MKEDKYSKVKAHCKKSFKPFAKLGFKEATGGWEDFPKALEILENINSHSHKGNNKDWYKPIETFLKEFENTSLKIVVLKK